MINEDYKGNSERSINIPFNTGNRSLPNSIIQFILSKIMSKIRTLTDKNKIISQYEEAKLIDNPLYILHDDLVKVLTISRNNDNNIYTANIKIIINIDVIVDKIIKMINEDYKGNSERSINIPFNTGNRDLPNNIIQFILLKIMSKIRTLIDKNKINITKYDKFSIFNKYKYIVDVLGGYPKLFIKKILLSKETNILTCVFNKYKNQYDLYPQGQYDIFIYLYTDRFQ
jgi:hypothetical protein